MTDSELKDILLGIQHSIISLQTDMNSFKQEMHFEFSSFKDEIHSDMDSFKDEMRSEFSSFKDEIHSDMDSFKQDITAQVSEIKDSVKNLELKLENETNRKIDALFDARIDEMRHRQENIDTTAKVANLEMRVDNLEKIIQAS